MLDIKSNEIPKALGLTPLEWEILEHRLSSDALTDCYKNNADAVENPMEYWHPDDIEAVGESLMNGELKEALRMCDGLTVDMVCDALEGTVLFYIWTDEVTFGTMNRAAYNRRYAAAFSLKKKLEDWANELGFSKKLDMGSVFRYESF